MLYFIIQAVVRLLAIYSLSALTTLIILAFIPQYLNLLQTMASNRLLFLVLFVLVLVIVSLANLSEYIKIRYNSYLMYKRISRFEKNYAVEDMKATFAIIKKTLEKDMVISDNIKKFADKQLEKERRHYEAMKQLKKEQPNYAMMDDVFRKVGSPSKDIKDETK